MNSEAVSRIIATMGAHWPMFRVQVEGDKTGELVTFWSGLWHHIDEHAAVRALRSLAENTTNGKPPTMKQVKVALQAEGALPTRRATREPTEIEKAHWAAAMNDAERLLSRCDPELKENGRLLMLRLMAGDERDAAEKFVNVPEMLMALPHLRPRLSHFTKIAIQQHVQAGGTINVRDDGYIEIES